MKSDSLLLRFVSFGLVTALFGVGFTILAVRLRAEQVDHAAEHRLAMAKQSFRRVQTAGLRGRIFDRYGTPLADNRLSLCIDIYPEAFRPKAKGETLAGNVERAVASLEQIIGRPPNTIEAAVSRHLRQELARPLTLWRDLTEEELARFSERQSDHPGFECVSRTERIYPQGATAAHLVGYVGREDVTAVSGSRRINYAEKEFVGREGLERHYDEFLRSMPGEDRVVVDIRGYATERETLVAAQNGCDLHLTLDLPLQRAVEAQLAGCRGACVVLDPTDGAVLAMASAPSYDINETVPVFTTAVHERLTTDPNKPMLNRASNGLYAPGSTFKPLTALAGLESGWDPERTIECSGVFMLGEHRLRCARRWGHGTMDMTHALRESCNPFFCTVGMEAGLDAIRSIAFRFGLGERTGLDFPTDAKGVVPDADWKRKHWKESWYPGDLAQMSIGQGMLLVTPLQMARTVAALGSGKLVTPRLNAEIAPEVRPLRVEADKLAVVREGMRMVVDGGTGRRAGDGVEAVVIGKTGTAEVGAGERRRKNTWFIAYATPLPTSKGQTPLAVAMVIENGESGSGTTAPKVAEVLKAYYNAEAKEEP